MKTGITLLLLLMTTTLFCQNKIYWTDRGDLSINRSNLDGSDKEFIIGANAEDLAFDLGNGKMYWTSWTIIRRSDIDGSNPETLVTGLSIADGIDLDVEGGKIYWTDRGAQKIQRSNLDGTDVEDLLDSPAPESIALDVENNKMYWTDIENGNQSISRANLDGTELEVIVVGGWIPHGLALDLQSGKMYWAGFASGAIHSANLDGTDVQEVVKVGLNQAIDVSLDLADGKMYWIKTNEPKIGRSNLDGTQVEELISEGLIIPTGIGLYFESTTATKEEKKINLEIRPNPSSGNFTVESGNTIKIISVYGIDGKFLFDKDVNSSISDVEMYNYPKGIYTLKIDFDNQISKSEKIIIQ